MRTALAAMTSGVSEFQRTHRPSQGRPWSVPVASPVLSTTQYRSCLSVTSINITHVRKRFTPPCFLLQVAQVLAAGRHPGDGRLRCNETILRNARQRMSAIAGANILVIAPPPVRGLSTTGGFKFIVQDLLQASTCRELFYQGNGRRYFQSFYIDMLHRAGRILFPDFDQQVITNVQFEIAGFY